jgi:predicted aminopeptidase
MRAAINFQTKRFMMVTPMGVDTCSDSSDDNKLVVIDFSDVKDLGSELRMDARMGTFGAFCAALVFQGCYTVKQGYQQARLLVRSQPIDEVLSRGSESPERLRKLKLVPEIMKFSHERLGLTPKSLYTKYIALEGSSVTWIVQAAERRSLRLKTWWFPVVGAQPYLGYFRRQDALDFRRELDAEGWDTSVGGVQAFSMLGYIPDPVYSSMLDGNSEAELAEVLFHEALHATLYIPGFSTFNENLANFYGFHGALQFLRERKDLGFDVVKYEEEHQRNLAARKRFGAFLPKARGVLQGFYDAAAQRSDLVDENAFLDARRRIFDDLASDYVSFMGGLELGSAYEGAFAKGRFNNAVFLGYSLYEARQEPFAALLKKVGGDLPQFLSVLRKCLKDTPENEERLWQRVQDCEGESR